MRLFTFNCAKRSSFERDALALLSFLRLRGPITRSGEGDRGIMSSCWRASASPSKYTSSEAERIQRTSGAILESENT